MAQTLLIGLGGTGSRAVNNVVKRLKSEGKSINDGDIFCAVLDTNSNDVDLINESGTGVPVIATSKNQNIGEYFADYKHKKILDWAPDSPDFRQESMLSGASEVRVKSRIAFMDCLSSGMADQLEDFINQVLAHATHSKISIMLVSSLSGGTGSGMFIQAALWLRQRLAGTEIVIRGILLLPDIFVENVKDIKDSASKTLRHYANAYAAIRELNAISKIRNKGIIDLPQDIEIDGLFNSAEGALGKPVFDFAFFIDDKDENNLSLGGIEEYELAVADLIYMQMYAPITKELYSEEDNLFLDSSKSEEPLYGSCGTSRAIYPVEDVLEYCKLRAMQDSLKIGWRRIDDEIAANKAELKQRKKEGYKGPTKIDEKEEYIAIYERETRAREGGIKDPFFASIADDNFIIEKVASSDSVPVKPIDKLDAFIKNIKDKLIPAVVNSPVYNPDKNKIDEKGFVKAEHTVEQLKDRVISDSNSFNDIVVRFDRSKDRHADDIVENLLTYTMNEDMETVSNTVLSLFTKIDEDDRLVFVHPVSARYMLIRLLRDLKASRNNLNVKQSKEEVFYDNDPDQPLFNNKATRKIKESNALEYLASKQWWQRETGFTDKFEREYAPFINSKVIYCNKYLTESLIELVFKKLEVRVSELLKKFDTLFNELNEARANIEENVAIFADTEQYGVKNLIVYGRPEHKEEVYQNLDLDLNAGTSINKSIILSLYGSLCADKRPNTETNLKYYGLSIVKIFIDNSKDAFGRMIEEDTEKSKEIHLNIFEAVCKESDYGINKKETNDVKKQRHYSKFKECMDTLDRLATPFLKYIKEEVNDDGTRQMMKKTKWGFHPDVVEATKGTIDLGKLLGVNLITLRNKAYKINEFSCYRGVYNLRAELVPKFNELTEGKYFTSYMAVINEMLEMQKGKFGDKALVQSPHIDKRWHNILPYVSDHMEVKDHYSFYRGIWLAVAYGALVVNKDGIFCLNKKIDTGVGSKFSKQEHVTFEGKPVAARDVVKLVEALRLDGVFASSVIPELEARFKNELEDVANYKNTAVIKGLTASKDDLNPIDMVVRYNRNKGGEDTVIGALIVSLENIAYELASNYHDNMRSEDSIIKAQYKILSMIYNAANLTAEKEYVFVEWNQKFNELKIKDNEDCSAQTEGTSDN